MDRKMKIKFKNIFLHTALVLRHKHRVFINCVKCGLPYRGLVHDLSKFSPTEFFESVRYYQGTRSPVGVARREQGISRAWLHHKGRNKHHIEYWFDQDCAEHPMIPYKYAVECVCDKLAATRTYAGKNYNTSLPLEHWNRYGCRAPGNARTKAFVEKVFLDVLEHGEKFVLNRAYMKKTYKEICLDQKDTAAVSSGTK